MRDAISSIDTFLRVCTSVFPPPCLQELMLGALQEQSSLRFRSETLGALLRHFSEHWMGCGVHVWQPW